MSETPKDSFAAMFEAETRDQSVARNREVELGARCRAEVVSIGKDAVFLEILEHAAPGSRRPQAYMSVLDLQGPDGQLGIQVGEVLEAIVVEIDPRSGELRLGRSAGRPAGLDELANAQAARLAVEGTVTGINKGGLEVEFGGVRAFCPISQADRGFVTDPQTLVGRSLRFLVTEIRDGGKGVVVSRRALLEQEAKESAQKLLAQLTPGNVVRGSVTSIREFGAFVDLGGIEGLIPNMELSHDRGAKASDLLNAGDAVDVQILEIKPGVVDKRGQVTTKVTLSLKALAADPWDEIATLVPIGKVVRGSVTRLLEFGAFVRLAPGVEGLLHISELGGKVSHPSALLKAGQTLNVVVRSIDPTQKRIALVPAPEGLEIGTEAAGPQFTIGTIVTGAVDRVEPYGVFVQIEGTSGRAGRGLIPNAELGTPRGSDTRKLFPAGKRITAKVLETGDGRLRLSIQAALQDQERAEFDGYRQSTAASSRLGTLGDLLKSATPAPGARKRK
jgi:small subunit ribosomal protein S1